MSPYYGDHIKKEREALNLIIRMKRANQRSHTGELIFFIVVPVAMAFAVMHFQDILLFCYKTQWASAAIKVVYPAWKWAGDAPSGQTAQTAQPEQPTPTAAGESSGEAAGGAPIGAAHTVAAPTD